MPPVAPPDVPDRDCGRCPRLVVLRTRQRQAEPAWHNAPVPSFGGTDARVLIVGLAPGLRGANRTGRPFTGDHAGTLLYPTMLRHGLASGTYGNGAPDDLRLIDCRVTNAVRCVPPENRPTSAEIAACNGFLAAEISALPRLRVMLALGAIAHEAVLSALGRRRSAHRFAHGAVHLGPGEPGGAPFLVDSYHCSRLNTNTGRLTPAMFDAMIAQVAALARG